MKQITVSNVLFWAIGLIGALVAVVAFILIATGVETEAGDDHVRNGMILFVSFIMCSGVAFGGLIIMALTQISSTLQRIERLLQHDKEKK